MHSLTEEQVDDEMAEVLVGLLPRLLRAVLYWAIAYALLLAQPYQDQGQLLISGAIGLAACVNQLRIASSIAIGLLLTLAIIPSAAFAVLAKCI
jgi:hypothetical protein